MIGILEWLLDLERIELGGDAPLSVRFSTPPAPWIMLAGAAFAFALVWRFYRKETVRRRWRWPLMWLRFGVVMTAFLLLGRPMLVLRRTHVEPSVVAVLLDRSASMAEADVPAPFDETPQAADPMQTRWAAAVERLTQPDQGLLHQIGSAHQVDIWTFGEAAAYSGSVGKAEQIAALAADLRTISPEDPRTDIAAALRGLFQQTRGRRLSAIVLASDGKHTASSVFEPALDQMRIRSVPLHVIAAGSSQPRFDIEVVSAWSEEEVLVLDTVNIGARLRTSGFASNTTIRVQLYDQTTHEVIAEERREVRPGETAWQTEFQYRPVEVGRRVLRVVALPFEQEVDRENNWAETAVRAHEEKVSVLFVEEVPRYEYRFLKNLLLREPTIESSCLLLGATAGFVQEGTRPIRHFPRSVEELRQYDVVILGDVDPRGDWLSPAQTSMLVDFVSVKGGGIAFIAGERNMPHRLRRTRLERLLPVQIAPDFFGRYEERIVQGFAPRLTVEGREHPIFRWGAGAEENDALISSLPGWYWFAQVQGAQPAATVLAVHPTMKTDNGLMPIAVLGRFGAGRTFYLGTDDLWRWRRYSGEDYYENVWLQVIRLLARNRKLGVHHPWRIDTNKRRYDLGEKVRAALVGRRDGVVQAGGAPTLLVKDAHGNLTQRVAMKRTDPSMNRFEGVFVPRRPGTHFLSPEAWGSRSGGRIPTRTISIVARDPERAHPEADRDFLERLAEQSGGTFNDLQDDFAALAARLPDRSLRIPDDLEEPLWDTRLMLALFVGLILAEWIIRKAAGLR